MERLSVAKGKVARLLSDYEIAINIGSGGGVEEGDTVTVATVIEVDDPDTGEALGSVLIPKARFEVRLVLDKMSVAKITERAVKPGEFSFATKKISSEPFEEDWRTILVQTGDVVSVTRMVGEPPPSDDDVPF